MAMPLRGVVARLREARAKERELTEQHGQEGTRVFQSHEQHTPVPGRIITPTNTITPSLPSAPGSITPGLAWSPSTTVWTRPELKFSRENGTFPSPHSFESKVRITHDVPHRVVFSQRALEDMYHIVDCCPEEVSWLGVVEERNGGVFFVDEIHLVEQEVGPCVTEMLTNGLMKLTEKLLAEPNGVEKVSKLRFWGHSHVNMDTSPSSQDETQVDLWKKNGLPYLIRAIMNKRGKLQLSLCLFSRGMRIDDASWSVERPDSDERADHWLQELTDKVKKPSYSTSVGYGHTGSSFSPQHPVTNWPHFDRDVELREWERGGEY